MIKFKKDTIAIWIGTSNKTLEEWLQYTRGVEKSKGKSKIEQEIGYIDVDFFGYYATDDGNVVPVNDLVAEAGSNSLDTDKKIVEKAKKMGILKGNRLYYYCNYEFTPNDNSEKLYNDLVFIGNFQDPFDN